MLRVLDYGRSRFNGVVAPHKFKGAVISHDNPTAVNAGMSSEMELEEEYRVGHGEDRIHLMTYYQPRGRGVSL